MTEEGRTEADWGAARHEMVQQQLVRRGIRDERVLAAMRTVPRHRFVPPEYLYSAYEDQPLPIGEGQTISQPYIVALMLEVLELRGDKKVLEVGTGSGYQTALLAELAHHVYTIERLPRLAAEAQERLAALGYKNISVVTGDGTEGLPYCGPFEAIIVAAAAPDFPEPLVEQLADGGRIAMPVGPRHSQSLLVGAKEGGELAKRDVCGVVFVPLIGAHGWAES
ncbi:MAG: protein-L-isoaspartate(D-aspartate) O-methyltransferase [Armatimonadota bacterium]|jgi:protein-L-isoaspartate(D-aspartate) O-methyltransferase